MEDSNPADSAFTKAVQAVSAKFDLFHYKLGYVRFRCGWLLISRPLALDKGSCRDRVSPATYLMQGGAVSNAETSPTESNQGCDQFLV